ncbi:MAG: nickel pincer cofactor biosynthesis protein LarC [Planctomycetaceae bacterium]|nr:nickel pincer cofactor biosynthesis protein LarC [Planctomycetaceae bacterium]
MRIAYLDCSTGISGDMTLAALIDAGVDAEVIRTGIASLGLEGVELKTETVIKGGFRAVYVRVEHPEQHAHRHLSDIHALIDKADAITSAQKELAKQIFGAVAAAEAKVHGMSIESVHFHEVGAIDSIVDIIGAAIGFDLLGADQIVCSALPTGRGQVRIDHGICTVPTPGTAELLKGIPLVDIPVEAELTTPTGAAIVTTLVDRFGALPEMTIESIGYGAGTRDFPSRANLLRLFVGTAVASGESDQITLLETNLDDVSGEIIGYTRQKLFDAGALDVFTVSIQMKKDRPGVLLSVLCRPQDTETLEAILFEETGTFGIRRHMVERSKRARQEHTVETPWGSVRGKLGWRHGEVAIFTPEFEDCAKLAAEHSLPLRQIYRAAETAFDTQAINEQTIEIQTTDHHHHDHSHDHHDHDHSHDHHHDHDHHD